MTLVAGGRELVPPAGESQPERPRTPRPSAWVVALVALLAAVVVGWGSWVHAGLVRVEDDVMELRDDLATSEEAAAALRDRVEALEVTATATFDPSVVAEAVGPSVFMVVAPLDEESASLGTGFVLGKVDHHSLVVTNYHVIEERWRTGADDVVLTRGSRRYTGEIVDVRPGEDLAVIDVAADLPALEPAATPVQVGDPVLVVGAGDGLEGTVTTGVASAIDRVFEGARWLQVSAQVNPGNSGGPVLDAAGQVLGVVTLKQVAVEIEGLSFAIPIDQVCSVLDVC